MKRLIMYRLYDPNYGPEGNKETLMVSLGQDNTFSYSLYGGWQDSGIGFAISNLQMRESLPIGRMAYKNVSQLNSKIQSCLRTGCGSSHVKTFEILNEL